MGINTFYKEIIIQNKEYRVIRESLINLDSMDIIDDYVVQTKFLWFWINIKHFTEFEYDNDRDFCKREAIELYDKLIEK